jgi:hypothetical protein
LRDFKLGMAKQDLNLADIKPTFEPAAVSLIDATKFYFVA